MKQIWRRNCEQIKHNLNQHMLNRKGDMTLWLKLGVT